jgi:hypothetical protein
VNLPEQYRQLSDLFEEVLSLSNMILFELERGADSEKLESLVERKDSTGKKIEKLTQEISSGGSDIDRDSKLRTLAEIKPLLKLIEKQTNLLEAVEARIQRLVKGKKDSY